jgi:hypothetical protein
MNHISIFDLLTNVKRYIQDYEAANFVANGFEDDEQMFDLILRGLQVHVIKNWNKNSL